MKKGLFITFEGNDGSGKTTQINLLSDYLKQRGYDVVILREPGGTPIGEKIRDLLLDNSNRGMSYVTEMLLYAAARAQLVETVIKPALRSGKTVVCDRFVDSSYAYQGAGRGLGIEAVMKVNKYAVDGCMPHITFFMDIDADTAMQRRADNGKQPDRIEVERIEFHRRVYEGYNILADNYPDRIKRIDVNKNPDEVFSTIKHYMEQLLKSV